MLNPETIQSVLTTIATIKEAREKARSAQNILDQEINATPVNEDDEAEAVDPPPRGLLLQRLGITEDQLFDCEDALSNAFIEATACAHIVAVSGETFYRSAVSKELALNLFGDYQLTVLSTKSGIIEVVHDDGRETFQLFIDGPEWSNEDGSVLFIALSTQQQAEEKMEEIQRPYRRRQPAP